MNKNEVKVVLNKLEEDPESVSLDECFECMVHIFGIPEQTLRNRYRNIKEGLPVCASDL